jgi:hypothetical protein
MLGSKGNKRRNLVLPLLNLLLRCVCQFGTKAVEQVQVRIQQVLAAGLEQVQDLALDAQLGSGSQGGRRSSMAEISLFCARHGGPPVVAFTVTFSVLQHFGRQNR